MRVTGGRAVRRLLVRLGGRRRELLGPHRRLTGAAGVVLASLAVLASALLGAWRQVKALGRDLGRAGERVGEASEGLNDGLAQLQAAAPPAPPPARSGPARGDGAVLAARVQGSRRR